MSEIHSRLGRGLGSMVSEVSNIRAGSSPTGGGFMRLPFNEINLPAGAREPDAALVESVKKFGVLQPVLVARGDGKYELLAGSRRLGAAKAAGLADVPALVIPPDRAGSLDVYLEENLTRTELAETEREQLRDRWIRETGRDAGLAVGRIPAAATTEPSPAPASLRSWKIATALLSALSAGLAFIMLNAKPVDQRPVVIPVEFIEQAPPGPPDNRWMDDFVFPGSRREIESSTLSLTFGDQISNQNKLTERGRVLFNQLAAVAANSDKNLRIELIAPEAIGNISASHLILEGFAQDRIRVRADNSQADLKVRVSRM